MQIDAGNLTPAVGRARAIAVGLVVIAAVSPQVGAALAVTLFDELGPAGAAFLRLTFAAAILWVVWRPRLAGDLRLAGAFGAALGLMNWSFYEAIDRIPLAVAVTIEFAGPLLVAVVGSRRRLDWLWILLAAAGIVLLVNPAGGSLDPLGVGLAVAAGACWMAYIFLSKRVGAAFPGGKHIALTRWSADAAKPTDQSKQNGNWQYCGSVSGSVISDFFDKWTNEESPEPGIM